MILRPRPTIWFELLTSREHFALAMQTLASTGVVHLQARPFEGGEPVLPRLDEFFAAFRALEADYGPYWPAARGHAGLLLENPIVALDETQARLTAWAGRADPIVALLRACEARLGELVLIDRLVEAVPEDTPLARLSEAESRLLEHAIYFLPEPEAEELELDDVLFENFPSEGGDFVIFIADQPEMLEVQNRMAALRATPVPVPDFLSHDRGAHVEQVRAKVEETERARAAHIAKLDALAEDTGLAGLLQRVAVLEWLQEHSEHISASRHMMRITGWTRSPDGAEIREALDAAEVDYALSLGGEGEGDAPMVLNNPGWLRAFEFFPRLLGMPAESDVDPSALTAAIAPVLFGFMFGDVGQGAVLMLAGLLLKRRMPFFALLIPGGAMAMVFGVLFGSVFSLEHVIPALWLHPLDAPVTLLAAALVLGAALLFLGLALDFTQAVWHRHTTRWLGNSGGLALAFVSLLFAWFQPVLAWGLPLGLGLTLAFAREESAWSPAAAGKAAAEFVEGIMRLFVSTVSFARVGAFALAHAGLSAAVVDVSGAIGGPGFWIALLIGNAIIIGLEGLVTGIQTTRLILFEFFIRFFRAEGREFHPLVPPQSQASKGSTP